ncbi:uncharacterized protein LOC124163190 isoform X2 [Ischnura elegans]|uniref:uncharacterized protein LOC124163190 isoform X2 n=1 Tax=Ischnura elegans TaxID=197161 RepID=UPI001ED86D24|nr:uncharacterized protein LOC124163190 isoform X2 [Ischnura elegans]
MARVPWDAIKLFFPCWLVESAPYKQAFTLSLVLLVPPLLLSPFLFSPLLILLLLSSATVVGALSAWVSMKALRMVLKHTVPLCLPSSLNSCLESFLKAILVHLVKSFPVVNSFPWAWFSFVSTLIKIKGSDQDGRSSESAASSDSGGGVVLSGNGETDGSKLSSWQSENEGEVVNVRGGGAVGLADVVKGEESLGFKRAPFVVPEEAAFSGGSESLAGRDKSVRPRKNIIPLSGGINGHQLSSAESSCSSNGNGQEYSVAGRTGRKKCSLDRNEVDIPGILSIASVGMQKCERKPGSQGHLENPIKESKSDASSCFLGPREIIGETKYTGGCSTHSWCQKGVNLEAELALLVEDIHLECLESWYPSLSGNEEFPLEFKVLLDMCVKRAASLGESSNISLLSIKLGTLFLCHLREFRKSRRKKRAAEAIMQEANQPGADETMPEESSEKGAIGESSALSGEVSVECTPEVSVIATSDSKSNAVGVDKSRSPRELSTTLYCTSSRDHASGLTKTTSEVLIGEEAYYRLRFGSSTRKKNVHAHYLVNLSSFVVGDFFCAVGKLPIDPEVKQYFRDFGSSLAESPAGKILVSMISRKVFLPLVDVVSDPQWLNARVASLLIDHVGAKVTLDCLGEEEEGENISYFSVATTSSEVSPVKGDQESEPSGNHASDEAVDLGKCVRNEENSSRDERRKSLSLPLEVTGSSITNPIDGRISSVLGGIISATAGPLLPDNVGISYKPIKRMWNSPSVEEGKEMDGEPEYKRKVRQFGRHIVDGLPVYSSALSSRVAMSAHEGEMRSDEAIVSAPATKALQEGIEKKSVSSLAVKKPTKKFLGIPLTSKQTAEVNTHSGLMRSKSSHDMQASSSEGNWHVEQGSELHEGAYLSDDAGSPLDGGREDYFSRKAARCRSFHGMNHSRQREAFCARFSHKQENLKTRGSEEQGIATRPDGVATTHVSNPVRSESRASSEDPFGDENDKVFDDDVVRFGKGLSMRWAKHSSGSSVNPSDLETELSLVEAAGSSSSQVRLERAGRARVGSRGKSLSDGDELPDVSRRERSAHDAKKDASGIAGNEMRDLISSKELDSLTASENFLQSSPLPGAENDSMNEIVKDISPVYEEVEDLPSTVAKLKAFLKERNGSQKSEESAPSSAEGGKRGDFDSLSSLELSLEQDALPLPKPSSSPLEERPFSCPADSGIFLNVRIPYTELSKVCNSSQSSNPLLQNSPQVFYCIEYDAAYPEEGADASVLGLSGADAESLVSSGNSSALPVEDHARSSENFEVMEAVLPSPGTVISHVVVKRQFQEFLDLHAQLEVDPVWRDALKGLKGPTRWLNLPFGKASASTIAGRRTLLQAYLRGVCTSMPQLASRSKALRTFMGYQGTSKTLTSGETLPFSVERVLPISAESGDGGVPRIDKFFARTVSGMFNTLKTALPGFDSQESTQQQQTSDAHTSALSTPLPQSVVPSHLDPSSAPAALGEPKATFAQPGTIKGTMMQLPAFLQFGNNNVATYPDLVDWDMDYSERDSGGFTASSSIEGIPVKTYSLEEDVRAFLEHFEKSPTTKEAAEFAFEALDPITDVEDNKDIEDQSLPKRNSSQYLVDSADEDGEEEELDALLPLCKLAINVLCEALRGTGSWVSQGTVVHATKVLLGAFIEEKLKSFLKSVTAKEMWRHYVHTLRVVLFHPPPAGSLNQPGAAKENRHVSEQQLATAIFTAFPISLRQLIGNHELLEAAKFIAESLQNKVILRELVLQVLHICITHLISSGSQHAEKKLLLLK